MTTQIRKKNEGAVPAATGHAAVARPMRASRSGPIRGALRAPGDKSSSHRALIFGLLALGRTRVEGLLEGSDILATAAACSAFGAHVEQLGPGRWQIDGMGAGSLLAPSHPLDFGNAGTGSRLMMGVAAGHPLEVTFDGDASLRKRPMRRILDPLVLMGAEVLNEADGGRLPVVLRGTGDPAPIEYQSPVPSAQLKSAILLAGLNAPGTTTIIESEASRDHTEKMMAYFGADLTISRHGDHGRAIALTGRANLSARDVTIPADPSSAAFALVAALIVPGSDLTLQGMMMNPLRTGLLTCLLEMGADIEILNQRIEGGEDVADLRVQTSALRGADIPAERAPAMIDEYPILAVAAGLAKGETRMRGLSELRVKESDRLAAVSEGLKANGVRHKIEGDDLIVDGTGTVAGGGMVATQLDHRIAMSFLVMGLASEAPVGIDDVGMIDTSFPTFLPEMTRLGAEFTGAAK